MMTYTPKPDSDTARLIDAIRKHQPRALRIEDLADLTGIEHKSIQAKLLTPVQHGLVVACKVMLGEKRHTTEYRLGSGIPPVSRGDYKTKQSIIPVRSSAPDIPISRTAQPEVAAGNTGSDTQDALPIPPQSPSLPEATPEPEAKGRGMGPAALKAPAGDVDEYFDAGIDIEGRLTIATEEGVLELSQERTQRLLRFIARPFFPEQSWHP